MPKRIDIAISNALSVKVTTVHGTADPLHMMTANVPPTVHGASTAETVHGAALPPTVHGAAHVVSVHGAVGIPLPNPQKVSRVEVRRAPNGDLIVTLHE